MFTNCNNNNNNNGYTRVYILQITDNAILSMYLSNEFKTSNQHNIII